MEHKELLRNTLPENIPLPAVTEEPLKQIASKTPASSVRGHWRRSFDFMISTFSPAWLPSPWKHPWMGYLSAICLPVLATFITDCAFALFPTFAFHSLLPLSAILLVALLWGSGPGTVATCVSDLLLNLVILHYPNGAWLQLIVQAGIFLIIGLTISLTVSRIEYAYDEAERVRGQLEKEKTMAAAQARELEAVIAALADGLYVYDVNGRVLRTNPQARAFNPSVGEPDYLARPAPERFASFLPRDEQGEPLTPENLPFMRILQGEVLTGANTVDTILHTTEGKDLFFSVSGAPIRDETGEIRGAVILTRDVTERRKLEQENVERARQTQQALQSLLHFAQALVQGGITQKLDSHEGSRSVRRVDQVAQRLVTLMSHVLGYQRVTLTTADETTGQLHSTAAHGMPSELEEAWRTRHPGFTIAELIAGTTTEEQLLAGESVVIDLRRPPFSELSTIYEPFKLLLVPMFLDGRLTGVVTYYSGEPAHEYTEDEQALAKALAQLAALTLERSRLFHERTQAQATVLALRETNRLMDEFIGIAGHELRTPLTTIKGSVQLARRQLHKLQKQHDLLSADATTMLTTIQGHIERTERQIGVQNRLINDLLDVARIHSNRFELRPELSDLGLLTREIIEDQHYLTPDRNIQLEFSVPDEVMVMMDADRVRQVISNYLSNALKYSDASKPVRVCLDLDSPNHVRFSVHDEGPGLSIEQQERIWERFYRVPEIEVKSGAGVGLGLGLHISRIIIERQGGQVGIESTPGQGSTFWFTLPLAKTTAHI